MNNLRVTYILYAVINNQIRGISYNPVAINGISYHYLEVKWQQTQEEANQIILYAKNSSNQEVYLVDGIINPSGESSKNNIDEAGPSFTPGSIWGIKGVGLSWLVNLSA